MTKSIRSINIIVRLDFQGHDVSDQAIQEAIDNLDYNFNYSDYYVTLMDSEIVDTFVKV